MKILLTNRQLVRFGGTEIWILTMARELVKRGHKVEVLTFYPGVFSKTYIEPIAKVSVNKPSCSNYDLIIVNHNIFLDVLPSKAKKIFTSHSYLKGLTFERFIGGFDKYVSITREIKDIEEKGVVINNPIDCNIFKPKHTISPKLTTALYMSSSIDEKLLPYLKKAFNDLKITLLAFNKKILNVEKIINEVDLVIGIGRCALEGMACGRNVLSLDYRNYQNKITGFGMITPDNFNEASYDNFTGRSKNWNIGVSEIKGELKKYDWKNGKRLRKITKNNYNVEMVVDKYLNL